MFSFRLAQEFKKRAADMIAPFPRGVVPTSTTISSGFDNGRIGAYASLGAIVLGGVMLVANIAHNHSEIAVAASPTDTPAPASESLNNLVAVKPAPEPDVKPLAVAPTTPVASPLAATDKSTVRIDTSTTGAIAANPHTHLKHKSHAKKTKELDSHT